MNNPAVILPAFGPPIFLRSALSPLICSLYSSKVGNFQTFSSTFFDASSNIL